MTMLANYVATMKPPLNCNPCFRMWALLVELSMAMVFGNMENERCFMKSKLKNWLTSHSDSWCECMHKVSTLWNFKILMHLSNLGTSKRIGSIEMHNRPKNCATNPFNKTLNPKPCISIFIYSCHNFAFSSFCTLVHLLMFIVLVFFDLFGGSIYALKF